MAQRLKRPDASRRLKQPSGSLPNPPASGLLSPEGPEAGSPLLIGGSFVVSGPEVALGAGAGCVADGVGRLSVCEGLGAASVPETAGVAGVADGRGGSSVGFGAVVGKGSNVSGGKGSLLTRGLLSTGSGPFDVPGSAELTGSGLAGTEDPQDGELLALGAGSIVGSIAARGCTVTFSRREHQDHDRRKISMLQRVLQAHR